MRWLSRLSSVLVGMIFGISGLHAAAVSGEDVYRARCASCHDQISARIPPRDALQKMSASRILRTLDFGLMMSIAYPMRREEREAVVPLRS